MPSLNPKQIMDHPWVAQRPGIKQFVKFSIVGAMNTIIDFSVFTLFFSHFHWHYLVANIMALLVAGTGSYIFNRRWTFQSQDTRWHHQLAKFMVVLGLGFSLNEFLLYLFVEHGHLHPLVAKAGAVVLVLFFNFFANRLWTFRVKTEQSA